MSNKGSSPAFEAEDRGSSPCMPAFGTVVIYRYA